MKYLGNVAQDKRSNACKPGRPTEWKRTGQDPSACSVCDGRYDPLFILLYVGFHAKILKRIRKDNIFTGVTFFLFQLSPEYEFKRQHAAIRTLSISWCQVKGGFTGVLLISAFRIKVTDTLHFFWVFLDNMKFSVHIKCVCGHSP